ncbi:MAG: YtxH domain-containing protein [Elusimicrobia bacterium]|nr:YtxH domain-containing protein [Elusimicrobiota bacterium]
MSDTKETCCETSNTTGSFFWLLTGVTVGAALAVLLAPKSGRETRGQIGDWWRDARDKFRFNRSPEDLDTRKEEQEELVEA